MVTILRNIQPEKCKGKLECVALNIKKKPTKKNTATLFILFVSSGQGYAKNEWIRNTL